MLLYATDEISATRQILVMFHSFQFQSSEKSNQAFGYLSKRSESK